LKLKLGEIECSGCNGTGKMNKSVRIIRSSKPYISTTSTESLTSFTCTKCHGTGKLDWIENVVGKRPNLKGSNVIESDIEPSSKNFVEGDLYYNIKYKTLNVYIGGRWSAFMKNIESI